MPRLALPPAGVLPKTGEEDPVALHYGLLTGGLYRARLGLAARLLEEGRYGTLLEVGYGSGIFLLELSTRAERLVGIDVHDEADRVAEAMRRLGVDVTLLHGSVDALPMATGSVDAVVCVSVLEHLTGLDAALAELRRILPPGGIAVLGFPVRNPATDTFFRLAGYDPRRLHPSGHRDILAAVRRASGLRLERLARFPAALPLPLAAYAGCRLRAR